MYPKILGCYFESPRTFRGFKFAATPPCCVVRGSRESKEIPVILAHRVERAIVTNARIDDDLIDLIVEYQVLSGHGDRQHGMGNVQASIL